jgi:thioredoxin reductase
MVFDTIILGAGPAGCSCALWLSEYGLRPLLVDKRDAACGTLTGFDFAQNWVLGQPNATLASVGAEYKAHLAARPELEQRFNTTAVAVNRLGGGNSANGGGANPHNPHGSSSSISSSSIWQLQLTDGSTVQARTVVLATGLSPLRPRAYFNSALSSEALLDAVTLTQLKPSLQQQRILLLGGGDNAVENAAALAEQGNTVCLSARHTLQAQQRLIQRLVAHPSMQILTNQPLPALHRTARGYLARWSDTAQAEFDVVAVLFGFQPNLELLSLFPAGVGAAEGVFFAGDVSQQLHPCVVSAVGHGAHVAKQIERWLVPRESCD